MCESFSDGTADVGPIPAATFPGGSISAPTSSCSDAAETQGAVSVFVGLEFPSGGPRYLFRRPLAVSFYGNSGSCQLARLPEFGILGRGRGASVEEVSDDE